MTPTSSFTDSLEPTDSISVSDVSDDDIIRQEIASVNSGVVVLPESVGDDGIVGIESDGGDFLKWLSSTQPGLEIKVPQDATKIILRSAEIWLPIIYVASDTSVQVFLNLVSSYIYEKCKGLLNGETARVTFSLVYETKKDRRLKRLEFSGDFAELQKIAKKFDINNFFEDAP